MRNYLGETSSQYPAGLWRQDHTSLSHEHRQLIDDALRNSQDDRLSPVHSASMPGTAMPFQGRRPARAVSASWSGPLRLVDEELLRDSIAVAPGVQVHRLVLLSDSLALALGRLERRLLKEEMLPLVVANHDPRLS